MLTSRERSELLSRRARESRARESRGGRNRAREVRRRCSKTCERRGASNGQRSSGESEDSSTLLACPSLEPRRTIVLPYHTLVWKASLSADGRVLAALLGPYNGDGNLVVFDTETGLPLGSSTGIASFTSSFVHVSPDGSRLLLAPADAALSFAMASLR